MFSSEDIIRDYCTHLNGFAFFLSIEAEQLIGTEGVAAGLQDQRLFSLKERMTQLPEKYDVDQGKVHELVLSPSIQKIIRETEKCIEVFNILKGNAEQNICLLRVVLGELIGKTISEQKEPELHEIFEGLGILDASVLLALRSEMNNGLNDSPEKIVRRLEQERYWYLTHIGNQQNSTEVKEYLDKVSASQE
jgi:hypothetical protein